MQSLAFWLSSFFTTTDRFGVRITADAAPILLLISCSLLDLKKLTFHIECFGEDFLMVNNLLLQCSGKVRQACYTRGELHTHTHTHT
uniref:Uncharacterized protein n=1 Tax=Nothobranchius furzeri TaxID=105023 RepID=A0A8C6LCQ8_NOTFU